MLNEQTVRCLSEIEIAISVINCTLLKNHLSVSKYFTYETTLSFSVRTENNCGSNVKTETILAFFFEQISKA